MNVWGRPRGRQMSLLFFFSRTRGKNEAGTGLPRRAKRREREKKEPGKKSSPPVLGAFFRGEIVRCTHSHSREFLSLRACLQHVPSSFFLLVAIDHLFFWADDSGLMGREIRKRGGGGGGGGDDARCEL